MAKRFTDTAKWDKSWYRKLGSKLRDVRQYILDRCDHAGLIEIDFETFEHFIGEPVTMDEIKLAFRDRVIVIDDKLFIPDFIEFQYGELSEECKPHKAVIKRLSELTLWEGYRKGILTIKDKDKDKDKEKDSSEKTNLLEEIFREYPKRPGTGKGPGLKSLSRQLKTPQDISDCKKAATNYRAYCEFHRTEPQFIKTFVVWCGSIENPRWREWIDWAPRQKAVANFTVPD